MEACNQAECHLEISIATVKFPNRCLQVSKRTRYSDMDPVNLGILDEAFSESLVGSPLKNRSIANP